MSHKINFNFPKNMNLGILFIKFNITGVITLSELDWIANHQSEFSRLDMALVLKIGRLMDKGIIELDCKNDLLT